MTSELSQAEQELRSAKRALREERRAARLGMADPQAAAAVARHFIDDFVLPAGTVVAAYWPLPGEFDCVPLMRALAEQGAVIALPAVTGKRAPLAFRVWAPVDPPPADRHEIPTPPASAERVRPALVVVPLLGFDAEGWRLGYGGGYYDRTLAALRATGGVTAVGVAYAAQEVPAVPHGERDQRLDMVVTERGVRRFR